MPQVMKEEIWWQPDDLKRFVAMAEMERRFGAVDLDTSVSLDCADDESEARAHRPTPSAPRDVVSPATTTTYHDQAPPLCREPGRPLLGFSPRYVAADELTAAIDEAFRWIQDQTPTPPPRHPATLPPRHPATPRSRPIEELSNEPNVFLKYSG